MKISLSESLKELPSPTEITFFKDLNAALRDGIREGSNSDKTAYDDDPRDSIDEIHFWHDDTISMTVFVYSHTYPEDKINYAFLCDLNKRVNQIGYCLDHMTNSKKGEWYITLKKVKA